MAIVGFDFGTTNSLISMVQGDRIVSFTDGEMPIPSVVCYEGGKTIVGRAARERQAKAGLGVQGNVVRSPKTQLGKESIFVGGVARSPVDVVRDVVDYVRSKAIASKIVRDLTIDRAVVTIPVNMQGHRRALLRDAFRMAGIRIVQFVHEPLAALYGYMRSRPDMAAELRRYDRQLILVFDWGGGTLDLTLCRLIDGLLVQVGNDGTEEVGGDIFDEEIRNEIEKRARISTGIGEEIVVEDEARSRLMHICEAAKIDLSQRSRAGIYVPEFFRGIDDAELDQSLSGDDLEKIVGHLIEKGLARIERLLLREGYTTNSVAMCLVTGGMANMRAIKSRLNALFGPQRVHVSERSASLISEGAAWVAHDNSKLYLAKHVELVLARNSYLPLLAAGLELPQEGEQRGDTFPLFCVDPADGHGRFQIVSPHRPGPKVLPDDSRRTLTSFLIKVDPKAAPFRERLELALTIDQDLILRVVAKSANQKDMTEHEVHDLEFALALPMGRRGWLKDGEVDGNSTLGPRAEAGALAIRSNVAHHEDDTLVPGEVMRRFNSGYFNTVISKPTQLQIEEDSYYQPCSICQRRSNDPLCRCASNPQRFDAAMLNQASL